MKYHNQPQAVDGEKYRSKRELRRHQQLRLLEKGGEVFQLRREVPFVLADKVLIGGEKRTRPAMKYVADFVYLDRAGKQIVEDAKGMQTDVYRLKKHLMKVIYDIDVMEV